MWPFKPKARPTCTQKIYDINPYYFFDDHRRPGIIQDLWQVKKAAIPEGEYSALRFETDKKYHTACMKKLEAFLTNQGDQSLAAQLDRRYVGSNRPPALIRAG